MTIRAKNHGAMQSRRERGDVEMPSLEISSFIFIYQVERCQVTRLTPPLPSSSSKQNPSFYRITRFSFFFPSPPFLVDPPYVYKETEGDIQRNKRALLYRARKLYSSAAIPSKNVCTNICRGNKSCFVDAWSFTRNVQS